MCWSHVVPLMVGAFQIADSAFYNWPFKFSLDLPFEKITLFILCGVPPLFVIAKILRVFRIPIDKNM